MKNVYKSEQRLCPIKCGNWRLGELYVCDVGHAGARVSNHLCHVCRVVPFVTAAGVSTGLVGSGQSLRTFLFVLAKTRACAGLVKDCRDQLDVVGTQQEERTGCRAAYVYINTYIIYAWRIGNGMSAECHRIARFGSICVERMLCT